jgi:hypothetical protein
MAWTLDIYDASGATLKRSFTQASDPKPFKDQFIGIFGPYNEPLEARMMVKNTVALIQVGDIIKYTETNNNWSGVVIRAPSIESPGAGSSPDDDPDTLELVVMAGGWRLLERSVIKNAFYLSLLSVGTSADVSEIALTACLLYAHPALTIGSGNFDNNGTLSRAYMPYKNLWEGLQELAKGDNSVVYVDSALAVHYKRP